MSTQCMVRNRLLHMVESEMLAWRIMNVMASRSDVENYIHPIMIATGCNIPIWEEILDKIHFSKVRHIRECLIRSMWYHVELEKFADAEMAEEDVHPEIYSLEWESINFVTTILAIAGVYVYMCPTAPGTKSVSSTGL